MQLNAKQSVLDHEGNPLMVNPGRRWRLYGYRDPADDGFVEDADL